LHNRGVAVDVGLVDDRAQPVSLPTDFDDFTEAAHQNAPVPPAAAAERARLRKAMTAAGFRVNAKEWWHYELPDAKRYEVEERTASELMAKKGS
jgi:D-alanyl-D-alanine dipeptidase